MRFARSHWMSCRSVWSASLLMKLIGCEPGPAPGAPGSSSGTVGGSEPGSDDRSPATTDESPPTPNGATHNSTGDPTHNSTGGDDESGGPPVDPPPEGVPVFIAQGHMGRTMLSCDDGRTWTANRSLDPDARCFEGIDCDHHEGSATGIELGGGVIVATWGWGTDGRIERSIDGVEWTEVLTGPTFSGAAYGNERFITGGRIPWRATAEGTDWEELGDSGLTEWVPRGVGFAPHDGGRFIIGGGGGGTGDLVLSSDNGDQWWHPDRFPAACGDSIRGITYGAGTIVIARRGNDGVDLCVSSDGGQSFAAIDLNDDPSGPPLWTGDELVVFSRDTRYTSVDGVNWSGQPLTGDDISIGPVARSPDGTYVAHRDGWMVWYEQQQMYRSPDGVQWEALPEGAFEPSHPIRHLRFGYLRSSPPGCSPPEREW